MQLTVAECLAQKALNKYHPFVLLEMFFLNSVALSHNSCYLNQIYQVLLLKTVVVKMLAHIRITWKGCENTYHWSLPPEFTIQSVLGGDLYSNKFSDDTNVAGQVTVF